ncbi:phage tail length tape measure family protein [Blastomonas sp. CCH1-A6]|uniref:phage tail length tape measure family protein n=1 Tax=Blastomonas sp. CCH1-A6 TaxID=1768762 RepID=UPI000836D448
MTLVVRARIEVDKGSAQADLRQASEAVKQVGDANREAATGAAALTSATNTMSSAQREAAQAVRGEAAAQDEATRAKIANTAAAGRQRAAYQQLGFQVQDVFQQFALGINPLVILAQQGGQVTSALALMGDTQQGTQSRFTRFMTFLSGPYGAAILGAVTIIGLVTSSLSDNAEAQDRATAGADGLAEAQSVLGKMFDLTSGKLERQNELLLLNARLTAINLRAEAMQQRTSAQDTFGNAGDQTILGVLRRGGLSIAAAGGFVSERDAAYNQTGARLTRDFERARDLSDPEARRKALDRVLKSSEGADFTGLEITANQFRQAVIDSLSADAKEALAAELDKSLNTGDLSPVFRRDGSGGRKPPKDTSADKAAREAQRLLDFTDAAEERVQRINEQFNEQPRLLDQAAKASRELDDIQKDVEKRLQDQPDKVKELTAAIKDARGAVEDALLRPFREMEEAGDRQLEQMMLVLQGREAEAEALQRIEQYQARNGDLAEEQRLAVLAQVEAERELGRMIEARGRQLSIYNASIDDTRAALEDLLSGGSARDFLKSMEQNFRQLQGRLLTEQLFGDALRKLEDLASGRDSLKTQTDKLVEDLGKPGPKASELADAMDAAAERINQAAQRIANPGLVTNVPNAVPSSGGELGQVLPDGTIGVMGRKEGKGPVEVSLDLKTFRFIKETGTEIGKSWLKPLEGLIGTKLVNGIAGVFGGAVAGRAQGGDIGAILGGLKSIEGLPDNLKKVLGGADGAGGMFGGAVAGFRTSQIMDALGIGNSKSGAAIGGAIGSAIPIPGADIIGSIAGGLIGQALKPTKRGSATITSVDGDATSRGNDQQRIQASLGLAGSVQQRLRQIAEEFDAEIGSFAVSIGQRGKNFRVDTTGSGKTKTKRGAVDFGQDEEAAVAFALRDAISDGAIKGLSAAIQKALNSNPDVDKAIKEALKVRDVEELLDGIGGKIRKEVRDFDRQADERLRIARDYGFDILEIERINAEERSKLIESILEDRVGALQDLLNDLVFGDLAEGTLSERRQRLLEEISKAEADAAKGIDGAADRLADLNRRLIQLSRDAYGTAGSEYASDRAQAIASAERIIQLENDRIRGTQEAAAETNRQLATANQLSNEQNDILAEINAGIRNLITLDGLNIAGGGGGNTGIDLGPLARSVNLK